MAAPAVNVLIEASQFPDRVAGELKQSLRNREVNPKFHYESYKQARKWLALHRAYSPFHTDAKCADVYGECFRAAAAARRESPSAHVIGLGCGSGEKDRQLLHLLRRRGVEVWYSPVDVSLPLVLTAHENATREIAANHCQPIVCDLLQAEDLPALVGRHAPQDAARLVTFFGMMPNFDPAQILPRLTSLLQPDDLLLFSANLAPGENYEEGTRAILPLYDNGETRDWLLTFLFDLGVEAGDGELRFSVEDFSGNLKAVVARFHFRRSRTFQVWGETFAFEPNDAIRLFFSCRHTPEIVRTLFRAHGFVVEGQWLNDAKEEGVFLARKQGPAPV